MKVVRLIFAAYCQLAAFPACHGVDERPHPRSPRRTDHQLPERRDTERLLIRIPSPGLALDEIVTSPDGKRVALRQEHEDGLIIHVDRYQSPRLRAASPVVFSADSRHFAFVGQREDERILVRDGRETPFLASALPATLAFGPDDRSVLMVVKHGSQQRLLTNEHPGSLYDGIVAASLRINPQRNRLGFVAKLRNQTFAVIDGVEGPGFDEVDSLAFSADGRHFAYRATVNGRQEVVLDGLSGARYAGVSEPVFSERGGRCGYLGRMPGGGMQVVIDGHPHPQVLIAHPPIFSQDGRHVAYYMVDLQRGIGVLVDGKLLRVPGGMAYFGLTFSATGKLGSAVLTNQGHHCVAIDHTRIVCGDEVTSPSFSPTGDWMSYAIQSRRGTAPSWRVMAKKLGPPSDGPPRLFFSSDGKRLAYVIGRGKRFAAVVDGVRGPWFDEVSLPQFSPDGRHVAYVGIRNRRFTVVLDGARGRLYDAILATSGPPVRFTPDGRIFYLALDHHDRQVAIYLVDQALR